MDVTGPVGARPSTWSALLTTGQGPLSARLLSVTAAAPLAALAGVALVCAVLTVPTRALSRTPRLPAAQ